MPHYVASDLGLHCFHMTLYGFPGESGFITVIGNNCPVGKTVGTLATIEALGYKNEVVNDIEALIQTTRIVIRKQSTPYGCLILTVTNI